MTFKEFKKTHELTNNYYLSFDWNILCDIAERVGYDPTDDKIVNYYGDHLTYLENVYNIDIWHTYISINDPDLQTLEQSSDEAFLREYFFNDYEVDLFETNEFGLIIKLIGNN